MFVLLINHVRIGFCRVFLIFVFDHFIFNFEIRAPKKRKAANKNARAVQVSDSNARQKATEAPQTTLKEQGSGNKRLLSNQDAEEGKIEGMKKNYFLKAIF